MCQWRRLTGRQADDLGISRNYHKKQLLAEVDVGRFQRLTLFDALTILTGLSRVDLILSEKDYRSPVQ